MKKIISAVLCTVLLSVASFSYVSLANSELTIPENATVVEIREDNFNDYFEDIKIIKEYEIDRDRLGTVKNYYTGNVSCRISREVSDMDGAYGIYNEENELWFISPGNVTEFIDAKSAGPLCNQVSGIYDEKNNILYHTDVGGSSGYAFSHFRENGVVSIAKFKTVTYGMPTIYKITLMTARFKNLPYITVSYNNELISFDQKPLIENGRTLVPLRAIFEKLGASIDWNGETQTVVATKDNTTISLTINNTTATKNGETITLDVPAKIISGRTLVPVRFIADCFGVDVQWNGDIQRVILTK